MKIDGNGQAKILNQNEIRLLFTEGLMTPRDRALFGVLLYCGCRVSEALALTTDDFRGGVVTLKKATTKGKTGTRSIPLHPQLKEYLEAYHPKPGILFPGRHGKGHMTRAAADLILKSACERLGLIGVSTHSFRRTALTNLHNNHVPMRVIQQISGHSSLQTLQRYLEVDPEQTLAAIATLQF